LNEIEGEVVAEAGHVDKFGKDERDEHRNRDDDAPAREPVAEAHALRRGSPRAALADIPAADKDEQYHGGKADDGEPADTPLAARQDDEGGEEGPDRRADIAADLEERLGQTVPSA